MEDLLNVIGINEQEANEIEVAEAKEDFKPLKSGIYTGNVNGYIFKTDSGAKMLKIKATLHEPDVRVLEEYVNVVKKDGQPNKWGIKTLRELVASAGQNMSNLKTKTVKEKCYGKEVDAQEIQNISSVPVTLFIREIFEEGGEYERQNEIENIFNKDGKNEKGEDQKEKFLKKIKDKPILKRKAKSRAESKSEPTKQKPVESAKNVL